VIVIKSQVLGLIVVIMSSFPAYSQSIIEDSANAQRLITRARSLNGHQPTTTTPGNQGHELNARRGGPFAAHYQEVGCGGLAIGNVRPVIGDHRQHVTTVIVNGNIMNSGNRCN
jgi:hypothetical protein